MTFELGLDHPYLWRPGLCLTCLYLIFQRWLSLDLQYSHQRFSNCIQKKHSHRMHIWSHDQILTLESDFVKYLFCKTIFKPKTSLSMVMGQSRPLWTSNLNWSSFGSSGYPSFNCSSRTPDTTNARPHTRHPVTILCRGVFSIPHLPVKLTSWKA